MSDNPDIRIMELALEGEYLMNNKEVSRSYEGPQDPSDILEKLIRDAWTVDISIGVHRPEFRGHETVQNMVRVAYNAGKEAAVCPMRCCEGLPKN